MAAYSDRHRPHICDSMGTVFAKIKPLLEAKDDTLKKGEMSVGGTVGQDTWIDNFIVGETEAVVTVMNAKNILSVDAAGKPTTIWAGLKNGR